MKTDKTAYARSLGYAGTQKVMVVWSVIEGSARFLSAKN